MTGLLISPFVVHDMKEEAFLLFYVPDSFLTAVFFPLTADPLSGFSLFGTICLVAGAVLAFRKPHKGLLWAPASFAASLAYPALFGIIWKFFWPLSIGFLCIQLGCSFQLFRCSKGTRAAAVPLAIFCATYALWALLITGLAFGTSQI